MRLKLTCFTQNPTVRFGLAFARLYMTRSQGDGFRKSPRCSVACRERLNYSIHPKPEHATLWRRDAERIFSWWERWGTWPKIGLTGIAIGNLGCGSRSRLVEVRLLRQPLYS